MSESGAFGGHSGGSRTPEPPRDPEPIREHVREVVSSAAFKGSRRGQQFLEHLVEKVISGHADELKERNLGVDLFGRPPSYDTGEDAIVRVTASDVRKRLHHFYAENGTPAGLRIELPSGSYIPEITGEAARPTPPPEVAPVPAPTANSAATLAATHSEWLWKTWWVVGFFLALIVGWMVFRRSAPSYDPARDVLPWSVLFTPDRPIQVILSDPDISTIQELLGFHISLSDYANRRYIPESLPTDAEIRRALRSLHGVNVPFVDVGILERISDLAHSASQRVVTHNARGVNLDHFRTDENFVILGSPRSNPWSTLFEERLDFRFEHDPSLKQEVIRNGRPRNGEPAVYIPTAKGFETGEAYGILALVRNPGQFGKVLLIAGTTAEATDAAGRLSVNQKLLGDSFTRCGIDPRDRSATFELLLKVRTIAGSPATSEVIACHALTKAGA